MALVAVFPAVQPSIAVGFQASPLTSTYLDHASAQLGGDEVVNRVAPGDLPNDFSSAVDAHAGATLANPSKLPRLVAAYATTEAPTTQQDCLAQAVYFEARGEPLEGQLAVAEVVLNRAASGKYPANLCEVIRQKAQFSFVENGRIPVAPKASAAWRRAVAIADIAVRDLARSRSGSDALYYHADYVAPIWRHGLNKVGTIGQHIFYR